MAGKKDQVCVVVPMYKTDLNPYEKISFDQIYKMLSGFPITFIHPESIDLTHLSNAYPLVSYESFSNQYFQGISGYNSLMMSTDLYKRFSDYKYMLIAQLDTYIFKSNLLDFCQQGYDYIGAPWLKKEIYQNFIFSYLLERKKKKYNKKGLHSKQNLFDKIGNGGLSLRKIESHIDALERHKDRRDFYLSHPNTPLYNEDVFFALEIPEFKYPSVEVALQFSFDKYPKYCYKLTSNTLPFGCHGWNKWKWRKFWKDHIPFPDE